MKLRRTGRPGFSLVEVLIALTILAVGILVIAEMQAVAIGGLARSRHLTAATQIATAQMEFLRSLPFSDINSSAQATPPTVNGVALMDSAGDSVLLDEVCGDGSFGGWRYYSDPRDEQLNPITEAGAGMNYYVRWRLNRGGLTGVPKVGSQPLGFPGPGQMVIHVQVIWWEKNEPSTVTVQSVDINDNSVHKVQLYSTRQQTF